jgi:hypothetical protein
VLDADGAPQEVDVVDLVPIKRGAARALAGPSGLRRLHFFGEHYPLSRQETSTFGLTVESNCFRSISCYRERLSTFALALPG